MHFTPCGVIPHDGPPVALTDLVLERDRKVAQLPVLTLDMGAYPKTGADLELVGVNSGGNVEEQWIILLHSSPRKALSRTESKSTPCRGTS